jgi:hypothetical protein
VSGRQVMPLNWITTKSPSLFFPKERGIQGVSFQKSKTKKVTTFIGFIKN